MIKGRFVCMAVGVLLTLSACSSGGDANEQANDVIALPGLRLFGLGGQPADQVFNPWAVNISMFRSESFLPDGFPSGTGDIAVRTVQ